MFQMESSRIKPQVLSLIVKRLPKKSAILLALMALAFAAKAQGHYQRFTVSTYMIQGTVQSMIDGKMDVAETWSNLTRNLKIDKIYIEVMRNHTLVDEAGLEKLKKLFPRPGRASLWRTWLTASARPMAIRVSIMPIRKTASLPHKAVEMAARHFDEILLDDYYFFDRKTDLRHQGQGEQILDTVSP